MFLFRHAGEVSKKVHLFGLTRKLLDTYIIVPYSDILRVFLKNFKIIFPTLLLRAGFASFMLHYNRKKLFSKVFLLKYPNGT